MCFYYLKIIYYIIKYNMFSLTAFLLTTTVYSYYNYFNNNSQIDLNYNNNTVKDKNIVKCSYFDLLHTKIPYCFTESESESDIEYDNEYDNELNKLLYCFTESDSD